MFTFRLQPVVSVLKLHKIFLSKAKVRLPLGILAAAGARFASLTLPSPMRLGNRL